MIDSSILQWIDKNRLRTSSGQRFEWSKHAFLLEPMSDWSRRIAIKKSAQIGFSESFGLLKAIYGALHKKWNIIYTLPTDKFAEMFSTTKLDPILNYNPQLKGVVNGSLTLKEIQNRYIYFRGTHSTKGKGNEAETEKGISVSVDLLIHDEMDRSDQYTIEQYGSRTENSDYAGMWAFSNPTYPGVGCDGLFDQSDQKFWMVKCSGCGHYQYLDWIKIGEETQTDSVYIDAIKEVFVCSKCGKEITDTDRLRGEWVAKFPGRDISGYWMSQLNYIHHTLPDLLYKERNTSKQYFCNFILGKSYRGTDTVVDRKNIINNIVMTDPLREKSGVAMGVDQGIWKHYVLGDSKGIFKIGKTKSWDVIEKLFREYNATMVVDALPYPNVPRHLVKKYRGRVYMCYYMKDKDEKDILKFMKKENRGVVKVQRTKYFDVLVDKFAQKEKPINMNDRELEEYITHWETLSRQDTTDAQGIIRGEWISSSGNDHFCHATLYQDVALSKVEGTASFVDTGYRDEEVERSVEISDDFTMKAYTIEELRGKTSKDWRYC